MLYLKLYIWRVKVDVYFKNEVPIPSLHAYKLEEN